MATTGWPTRPILAAANGVSGGPSARSAWRMPFGYAFTECERLTSTPIDTSDQAKQRWRRAAKLYGIAVEHSRRGGLGLRAIAAWTGASKCFETLGMTKEQEGCRLKSVSIPVYYGEVSDE